MQTKTKKLGLNEFFVQYFQSQFEIGKKYRDSSMKNGKNKIKDYLTLHLIYGLKQDLY